MRLTLALLLLASSASAQSYQQAVVFGAEWDDYNAPVIVPWEGAGIIWTYAGTPPSRGISTVTFPNGGRLWDWEWSLTAKRPEHILLASLAILGTDGRVRRIGMPLFFDFREKAPKEPANTKMIPRGGLKHPIRLNPGDMVFLGVYGWGEACALDEYGIGCSVMEGHAALYVDEGTVTDPVAE